MSPASTGENSYSADHFYLLGFTVLTLFWAGKYEKESHQVILCSLFQKIFPVGVLYDLHLCQPIS